jgi:hypothetical protein
MSQKDIRLVKKTIQLVPLTFALLTVLVSGCTSTATPTIVTTTVPPTIKPSPLPPTFTPEPPAIDESVKVAIGEIEYSEITTGEIKGIDYVTGKDFDGTVEASSVKATNYNDSVFSHVVTGEATDSSGKKFSVIWNEEQNHWFKSEIINTDLNADNTDPNIEKHRTSFGKQLQEMVSNRDLYRMLLTQIDTTFPANTETARFWLIPQNRGQRSDPETFYLLDMSRADYNGEPDGTFKIIPGQETAGAIYNGRFTKGNEPYRYLAMIDGIATGLKNSQGQPIEDREFSVIPLLVQNTDGRTMIWFGGLDWMQREDIFFGSVLVANNEVVFGSHTVGPDGLNGLQRMLINQNNRMTLIIPPADGAHYNVDGKKGWNTGGLHYRGSLNYPDDAIIAMQDQPGAFNKLLDQNMNSRLDSAIQFLINGNYGENSAVPFVNGLPQNVIEYLSNHIFETYYNEYGSK